MSNVFSIENHKEKKKKESLDRIDSLSKEELGDYIINLRIEDHLEDPDVFCRALARFRELRLEEEKK